jgi:DNA-binding beta-propeller fold protein YncE
MRRILPVCLLCCLQLAAQPYKIPRATELPSDPFYVKASWFIGGAGNWDGLTVDPVHRWLYIAHGATVQIVDLESGSLSRQITGFGNARAIALDDSDSHAYISDAMAKAIRVVDRQYLSIEATIDIGCSPRSVAFEPRSGLVFAVCGTPYRMLDQPQANILKAIVDGKYPFVGKVPIDQVGLSHLVAIDPERRTVLADMIFYGDGHEVQPDGFGHLYLSIGANEYFEVAPSKKLQTPKKSPSGQTTPCSVAPKSADSAQPRAGSVLVTPAAVIPGYASERIAKLDAGAIAEEARHPAKSSGTALPGSQDDPLDWLAHHIPDPLGKYLPVDSSCGDPRGLVVDGIHGRLFVACGNQKFAVLDAADGTEIASLTTGPGDETLAYDADRQLLFTANNQSLTVIRQDANVDSYAVVQNLSIDERARTVAVDPSTGKIYMVTDLLGVDLSKKGGIGTLHLESVPGSFHVVVVGH